MQIFPSEQSLSTIDDVIGRISSKIEEIDDQTRQIVHGQWKFEEEGQAVVEDASKLIQSLFSK